LEVKRDIYRKKKNRKWEKKMEMLLKSLLEDGERFSDALVNASIITPAEELKFRLATTESDGIRRILEESTHKDSTIKYFLMFFGGPLGVSIMWLLTFNFIKQFNHDTFKPLDKVIEIQGGPPIEFPILFEDPIYFQTLFVITLAVTVLVVSIYIITKSLFPTFFNSLFTFKSNQIFSELLEELNKGRRLGVPDMTSSEYLMNTTSDGIKRQIYREINRIQETGDIDKTISGVFENYNFDSEVVGILEIGERELSQFWEYSSVAETIMIEKRHEYDNNLDKVAFLFFYYVSSAYFVIPFFILGVFYMFDVTAQVM